MHGLTYTFILATAWPIRIKIKHSFYYRHVIGLYRL